jgi:1-acyl-sn-glycerol-3-phosphate acyltransferase
MVGNMAHHLGINHQFHLVAKPNTWKNMSKIQDFSIGYELPRRLYFRWAFNYIYYKKVVVMGFENIPHDRPVILAPNHQNTVTDALTLVSKLKYQPVFLARQDVFRPGIISSLLTWIKIMPVYRIRDGVESLSKNDEIFKKSVDVLWDNKQLCVMAEGNHGNKRHLRPFVKGMFRIAFMAQDRYKEQPGVVIVPVGLEYSHYYKMQNVLIINFGKPIEVNEFYQPYQADSAKTILAIRDKLAEKLSDAMLDIRSLDFYDTIYFLQKIYPDALRNKKPFSTREWIEKFSESRQLVKKLDNLAASDPEKMKHLNAVTLEYIGALEKLKLRDWLFFRKGNGFLNLLLHGLLLLIFLPVFIFGFVNNIALYALAQKAVKNIKDFQFHGSVMFSICWLGAPFYFLIIFFIVWLSGAGALIALIYTTTAALSVLPAFLHYIGMKKWIGKFRFSRYASGQNPKFIDALQKRKEILSILKNL